jgi:uncharacterized protein
MIHILTEQQIDEIMKDNVWGHLGCNDGFNTYIYPSNYLYDGVYITCHSQPGFKIEVMRQNTRVCFQVDEVKNNKNWKSVMLFGEFEELTDEQQCHDIMKAFADRRLFLKISESTSMPVNIEQNANIPLKKDSMPAIYRIVIDEKTGRYENE